MRRQPLLLLFTILFSISSIAQTSVTTQHNDLSRSGWNNNETKLTPSNVNAKQFGALFRVSVDDQLYAQPLVVANVVIGGKAHNVVYVATVNNTVYAIDGDNGNVYWSKTYTPNSQRPPKNTDMYNDFGSACGVNGYHDFSGNIGIVGTPVIDSAAQTIYFVARSIDNNRQFYQYLHAVDITTGNERTGSPVLIDAVAPGAGDGNVNYMIHFDAQHENQRQALTLYKDKVYLTFSSHCDWAPYHGWILGYDKTTLQQKSLFNPTPDGYNGGLWESGGGPTVDANNNMYVVTGNGSLAATGRNGANEHSESALQLNLSNNGIKLNDYFTPNNYDKLEAADLDYGGMASILIPNTNIYFTGGKDGNLYLLDTANLGGYNASANNVKQTIALGGSVTLRCQPSYYRSTNKEFVYVWSENSQLKAFPVNRANDNLDVANLVTGSAPGPQGANGAVLSTSSNNFKDGTGIVWASYASDGDANQSTRPGILRAFDANDITKELWNSNQNSSRDAVGNYAKFASPTIANGKVYLPTFSNQLIGYGIVDSTTAGNCTTNIALNKPAIASSTESNSYAAANVTDNNNSTKWSSASGTDPQWIYVDLGQRDSVCNVTLQWDAALGKDFQIQISDDASHWTTLNTITGNSSYYNSINVNAAGRYVRMYGTARGTTNGYSINEFQIFGSVIQGCATPTSVTVNRIDVNSAVIRWNAANTGASYNVQYKLASTSIWQTVSTTNDSLPLTGLSCGNYYNYRVQSVCNSTTSSSYSQTGSFNTLACNNCGFLPTRFYTNDIGNVGIGGSACFNPADTFLLKGSGKDIGDTADAFRFLYKTYIGDGTIEALVQAQDGVNPLNKAGIMFRQSLNANSANVFVGLTSGGGDIYQARTSTGDITKITKAKRIDKFTKAPYYVMLVKKGTIYKAYVSADHKSWRRISIISVPGMGANGSPIYAGLAVSSHDNSQLSAATFTQFNLLSDSAAGINNGSGNRVELLSNDAQKRNPAINLNVHPNPSAGNFTVDFTIAQKQNVMISIAGLGDGKIYYTESLTNFSGSYNKDNTTFHLRSGSYVVFVKTQTGIISRILLKQ